MKEKRQPTITIEQFMIDRLKLSGNDLIMYALIFSFSKDNVSEFYGTKEYISKRTGISRTTVYNILDKLRKRGYIIKNRTSYERKTPSYRINPKAIFSGKPPAVSDDDDYDVSRMYLAVGEHEAVHLTMEQISHLLDEIGEESTDLYIKRLDKLLTASKLTGKKDFNPNHYQAIACMIKNETGFDIRATHEGIEALCKKQV